jgi:hypothetical protein
MTTDKEKQGCTYEGEGKVIAISFIKLQYACDGTTATPFWGRIPFCGTLVNIKMDLGYDWPHLRN